MLRTGILYRMATTKCPNSWSSILAKSIRAVRAPMNQYSRGRPAIELGVLVTAASPNSDGVFEIFCDGRATWDLDACIVYLAAFAERQETLMDEVQEHVYQLRGSPGLEDDFLIIEARLN